VRCAGTSSANAGQSCINPTRFLVERAVYGRFVDAFVTAAKAIKVGDGLDAATNMGPLANARRITAMEEMVADAVKKGAVLKLGGKRMGTRGYFFEPTVLIDVPVEARAMNEEPFGPCRSHPSIWGPRGSDRRNRTGYPMVLRLRLYRLSWR